MGNMEYQVADDAPVHPALSAFGAVREDGLQFARYADVPVALRIVQSAGWR